MYKCLCRFHLRLNNSELVRHICVHPLHMCTKSLKLVLFGQWTIWNWDWSDVWRYNNSILMQISWVVHMKVHKRKWTYILKYVYKYLSSKWIYLGFYDFNFDITSTKSLVSLDNKSSVMTYKTYRTLDQMQSLQVFFCICLSKTQNKLCNTQFENYRNLLSLFLGKVSWK